MSELLKMAGQATTITFDCYGTLIDWAAGLTGSLSRLFPTARRAVAHKIAEPPTTPDLARLYVEVEAEVEAEGYRRYREVMRETALRMGRKLGQPVSAEQSARFAAELPTWKPFADTNQGLQLLKSRYRLGVLSNIDRDLFVETSRHFSVDFDFVITAEDVGSYKPELGHFERLLSSEATRDQVIHVAQSQYHDGRACRELGIAFVWINRYKDARTEEADPLAEFLNLIGFAHAVMH